MDPGFRFPPTNLCGHYLRKAPFCRALCKRHSGLTRFANRQRLRALAPGAEGTTRDQQTAITQLLQQRELFRKRQLRQTTARLAFALQHFAHELAHVFLRNLVDDLGCGFHLVWVLEPSGKGRAQEIGEIGQQVCGASGWPDGHTWPVLGCACVPPIMKSCTIMDTGSTCCSKKIRHAFIAQAARTPTASPGDPRSRFQLFPRSPTTRAAPVPISGLTRFGHLREGEPERATERT